VSRAAGIDIGSRTVKLAVVAEGQVERTVVRDATHNPMAVCRERLERVDVDRLGATGYGRHLFARHFDCTVITEILAVALGARFLHPACRAVLDVGGQDTKVVALDVDGCVRKFEMNDRCAAGTGRFLEVMAVALGYTMEEFIVAASAAASTRRLNSMCTVFAESEVISAVARGTPRDELALGIHRAIADRSAAMLRRMPLEEDVLFCGGGARNDCLCELVAAAVGRPLHRTADPQVVAAVGCALHALNGRAVER
jgi:predicted CoA-substrate-specific enzyme activase